MNRIGGELAIKKSREYYYERLNLLAASCILQESATSESKHFAFFVSEKKKWRFNMSSISTPCRSSRTGMKEFDARYVRGGCLARPTVAKNVNFFFINSVLMSSNQRFMSACALHDGI